MLCAGVQCPPCFGRSVVYHPSLQTHHHQVQMSDKQTQSLVATASASTAGRHYLLPMLKQASLTHFANISLNDLGATNPKQQRRLGMFDPAATFTSSHPFCAQCNNANRDILRMQSLILARGTSLLMLGTGPTAGLSSVRGLMTASFTSAQAPNLGDAGSPQPTGMQGQATAVSNSGKRSPCLQILAVGQWYKQV